MLPVKKLDSSDARYTTSPSRSLGSPIRPREVRAGCVHALTGQDSSGKPTLIKIPAGYHGADPGDHITVDGISPHLGGPSLPESRGLRFVQKKEC
jgi:ABC-type uncharacterized transport system ATPase subunit